MDTIIIWFAILWVLALIAFGILYLFFKSIDVLQERDYLNDKKNQDKV